jgi:hypothetical protein
VHGTRSLMAMLAQPGRSTHLSQEQMNRLELLLDRVAIGGFRL